MSDSWTWLRWQWPRVAAVMGARASHEEGGGEEAAGLGAARRLCREGSALAHGRDAGGGPEMDAGNRLRRNEDKKAAGGLPDSLSGPFSRKTPPEHRDGSDKRETAGLTSARESALACARACLAERRHVEAERVAQGPAAV